jgi:hypothetical protein
MNQVKALLLLEDWPMLTGVDVGSEITDGITVNRYGVRGYPTTIVVDAQGTVSFSSAIEPQDTEMFWDKKMQKVAATLGIPWPIDRDAEEAEFAARTSRFFEYLMGQEIDAAMAKTSHPANDQ